MTVPTYVVDPEADGIVEVFDGKNWKQVDTAQRAYLVWSGSPSTRIEVLAVDVVGGGNKVTLWPMSLLPPFRVSP